MTRLFSNIRRTSCAQRVERSVAWATLAFAFAFAFALSFATPGHAQTVITPSQPGAWLVFLCRASDASAEPRTPAWYGELFDAANADLVNAYFKDVSFGKVNLTGTVVLGWFPMRVTTAQIAPAVRNNSTNPNRSQTAADCKAAGLAALAATSRSVDPDKWAGFIAVINVNVDAGQAGRTVIANALEPASFYEHEMLHVMGQYNHSHNLPNDPTTDHAWGSTRYDEYNDPWDIMSYDVGLFSYQTTGHGETGPTLNNAYRSLLGWLPAGRVTTVRVRAEADRTLQRVTLAPVSEPQTTGPLLVVVDLPNNVRYVIEYHAKSGFDRGAGRGEVVVREWRTDGATYLVRQTNGHVGFVPGEGVFTDIGNRLAISVEAIRAAPGTSATVAIDPGYQVPPPHGQPVACSVFDDGNTRKSAASEAVFFNDAAAACIPDGSATGLCRKWFGACTAIGSGQAVNFQVFDDGNQRPSAPSNAVYNRMPGSECIPDGTSGGNCRKWFGLARTADGHAVQCYLFDDGLKNWVGPTDAIYYRARGQVCMPDGTSTGTCRKWFGNCQVAAQLR